jgi:hypothetical protein
MTISNRVALSHPVLTGISRKHLGGLIEELADPWLASAGVGTAGEARPARIGCALRVPGPNHRLPFVDRVIATLVIMRFQLPHAALAVLYGVDRSTVTRAVHEIRPLLEQRGFAVPGRPGVRLHTLTDVFAYAAAEGVELRIDRTEVQVRRPAAHKPGRRAFVSGKKKQNTCKSTVISDDTGRLLWSGAFRPGRMHDVTALRTEGIENLLRLYPAVKAKVDSGYQGLARDFPDQITARPKSPARMQHPRRSRRGRLRARPSPHSGSASSTPSPNPSSGEPSSVGSAVARTTPPPPAPSPGSSPTAALCGKRHQPDRPDKHAPTSFAHEVVKPFRLRVTALPEVVAVEFPWMSDEGRAGLDIFRRSFEAVMRRRRLSPGLRRPGRTPPN